MQIISIPSVYSSMKSVYFHPRARLLGDLNSPPTNQNHERGDLSGTLVELMVTYVLCMTFFLLVAFLVTQCNYFCRNPANKGLKKNAMNALPKQAFTSDEALKFTDCVICLAEFTLGDEIRVLPECGHCYHVVCIDTWLSKHSSCPSCRQILAGASHTWCCKCPRPLVEWTVPLETPNVLTSFPPLAY